MSPTPCILVHGGAGPARPGEPARRAREGCLAAARVGWARLAAGASALDAVVAAVAQLEDDPTFNAGYGSVLNLAGEVEMDAAVMDGTGRRAGAVGAVQGVRNPVLLARAVMERTPHLLLVGPAARRFAEAQGLPTCEPAALVSPGARERFEAHGTVGAVACDAAGRVAAATSTGGTQRKLPGRVGDSPLVGCGTYAHEGLGAASATGQGEAIIRALLTRCACERLRAGSPPPQAAREALEELARLGGEGGLILVDAQGRMGWAFNSERLTRAWVAPGSEGAEA